MHPIDVKQRDHHEPASDSRAGWWILMALVAATILVVALVMASGTGEEEGPAEQVPSEQPADPAL